VEPCNDWSCNVLYERDRHCRFSVLCFSNFVPTIMFGLLVAIAMGLSFVANLTLLPALLVLILGGRRSVPDITVAPEALGEVEG
ncbi:MAG: hypothetical protein O7E57_10160, partial [Gammaproteobacteria bacterium]|nr:hypothetical protein [Gammaproteobacteria bacterium]